MVNLHTYGGAAGWGNHPPSCTRKKSKIKDGLYSCKFDESRNVLKTVLDIEARPSLASVGLSSWKFPNSEIEHFANRPL